MALTIDAPGDPGAAMVTPKGVLAHSELVAASFGQGVRVDPMAHHFGDIVAVSRADLAVIPRGPALLKALVGRRWSALLMATPSSRARGATSGASGGA